jgi:hypothetical protein
MAIKQKVGLCDSLQTKTKKNKKNCTIKSIWKDATTKKNTKRSP